MGITVIKKDGGGGSTAWGDITGTLSNQTDLQSALDSAGGGGGYSIQGLPFTSITSTSFVTVDTMTLTKGKKYIITAGANVSTNGSASTNIQLMLQASEGTGNGVAVYNANSGGAGDVEQINGFGNLVAFSGTVLTQAGNAMGIWYLNTTSAVSDVDVVLQGRVSTGTLYVERYIVSAIEVTDV